MTMNAYESMRVDLMTLVKSFHTTYYSTTEVNEPKRLITDVEHATQPFVTVEIVMKMHRISLSNKCFSVGGRLILNFFARKNSGSKVFSDYTDKLSDYFGTQIINGITFREVVPISNKLIPGFDGEMNSIEFERDYFKS